MTFWVVKVVRVVKGACLSEERRVKSEKFGSVPKSVSGKNPLKFVNFKCHCKFNVLFLIVL